MDLPDIEEYEGDWAKTSDGRLWIVADGVLKPAVYWQFSVGTPDGFKPIGARWGFLPDVPPMVQ